VGEGAGAKGARRSALGGVTVYHSRHKATPLGNWTTMKRASLQPTPIPGSAAARPDVRRAVLRLGTGLTSAAERLHFRPGWKLGAKGGVHEVSHEQIAYIVIGLIYIALAICGH
jgi:hypothetical protein